MRENIPLLITKKILIFLVSVWLLSLAVFCMARLAPSDPLTAYYGERVEKMTGKGPGPHKAGPGRPPAGAVRRVAAKRPPRRLRHLL